jgi:hypothetical protein
MLNVNVKKIAVVSFLGHCRALLGTTDDAQAGTGPINALSCHAGDFVQRACRAAGRFFRDSARQNEG